MKTFMLNHIPAVLYGEPSDKVFLYVHGRDGNKEVAVSFYQMIKESGWQVLSIDLPKHGERLESAEKFNPWMIVPELSLMLSYAKDRWETIGLCADGIGAYFALCAFQRDVFDQAVFISPNVDMARYIDDALEAGGLTPEDLKEAQRLDTVHGVHLSWDYYLYTHENPIRLWDVPTQILIGKEDIICNPEAIQEFAQQFGCGVTVASDCDHSFSDDRQKAELEQWIKKVVK